jgi:hypothetical protein
VKKQEQTDRRKALTDLEKASTWSQICKTIFPQYTFKFEEGKTIGYSYFKEGLQMKPSKKFSLG